MDTLELSRLQFALNITFHILFPAISIGLAWFLVYFKVRALLAHQPKQQAAWMRCYHFWVKIFALTFALGVVSGITMSFQFGTNWPGFMEKVSNVAGPLLGYEVLTAFFMEATFLGIMLFGVRRTPAWLHTLATACVAVGTVLSAFWIIALNSWMHTPVGFELRDGVVFPIDWWQIIFNPSMPYRLSHGLLASALTAAFMVAGLSAYRLRRGDVDAAPKLALRTALTVAVAVTPLQILSGDLHGLNTLQHQPAKIAAMEGIWQTRQGAPFVLWGWPDEAAKRNQWAVEIPKASSFILTHDWQGEVQGLDAFEGEHPPVAPVFFAFRIMLSVGMIMLIVAGLGAWQVLWRGRYPALLLRALVVMTFSGWVATVAGWYVTEIGRQPYLVYGLLTTAQAVTDQPSNHVAISLLTYALVYVFLLISFIGSLFYLARQPAALAADPLPPAPITSPPVRQVTS